MVPTKSVILIDAFYTNAPGMSADIICPQKVTRFEMQFV